MLRSVETINRNMNILQKKLENTSANITNVNTPGYKFQNIIQSTLEGRAMMNYSGGANLDERQDIGHFVFGNQIDLVYKNFEQGILNKTDKTTDFGIVGNGFFTIEMDNGLGFTRNGNFRVNDENQLTTMEGYPVMGVDEFGELTYININDSNFNVDNRGNILNHDMKLLIVDFDDYQALDTMGDTIFTSDEMNYIAIDGEISQGYLELSNVNVVDEMVKMIEVSREFESNQKILSSMDETLSKAVNEIGRV
ncbi:MAG: flagellar hook-basal body complex protein [Tissierellaceae bacterium]|nr:flagellar hook-basal body complex protein [Tissierellaceae bacterium]